MKFPIEKNGGLFDLKPIYTYFRSAMDGVYIVGITKSRRGRTNNQNEWLWGCVYPLLLEGLLDAGWEFTTVEQVHEYFKSMLASAVVVNRDTGEVVEIPQSTAQMDTVQFSSYVQKLRDYASEYLNVEIPDPDKNWRDHGENNF
jgi:hypothetical protein